MKVLVTGGTGMVGSAFAKHKTHHDIILVGSKDYDLTSSHDTKSMFIDHSPDAVIHLAARVGGVKSNSDYIADFYCDNILINTNVLNSAKNANITKVISLLSTCVYPDKIKYPLTEDHIHDGEPHKSNFGYAYAKRMLDIQSRAIRSQYGLKFMTMIPNNLYGTNDNFGLFDSHVIPAMIRKIYEAKYYGSEVVLWGTGKPLREFTFADDIARILIKMLNVDHEKPINVGNPGEYSINFIAKTICNIFNYDYNLIQWDTSFPAGQYRKPSSNEVFREIFPDFKYTDLSIGLEKTCSWFAKEYPNVRGV